MSTARRTMEALSYEIGISCAVSVRHEVIAMATTLTFDGVTMEIEIGGEPVDFIDRFKENLHAVL